MPRPSCNLERVYDEQAQALFAFTLNLTRNLAETEDVLQDIFAQLAARPELLRPVKDERAFLFRMAYLKIIDTSRRRQVRERYQESSGTEPLFAAPADPDDAAFREALSEALAQLPLDQRAAIHLKLWENKTAAEIGEALQVPANTAASRCRYAIDKLRTLLRPIYEEIQ